MTTKPIRYATIATLALLALEIFPAWAAKAPISAKDLKKESTHIVTGKVVSVTSKVQKSKVEKGLGIHRDKEFSITLKVDSIAKGKGIKVGDEMLVVAWRPHTRLPPLPGLQGHGSIPEEGDSATFYLKQNGKSFEPLMPNGIDIKTSKRKGSKKSKSEGDEKPKPK